ncbi:MAG: LysR family transcriptional regulator [Acidimicrobiales bacterium]
MDVSLQQLRMLREVATRGTIAAAADSLGYTASAVSQQLGGIEKATGVAVLERVGRNVRLTDPGRELVRHATGVLDRMEAAQVAMEQVSNEVRGVLTLTVYESVAATLLAPLLARLGEAHPDLDIRTRQLDPEWSLDALTAGDIDLAFAIDYPHAPVAGRQGIIRHPIKDDRFHLVVPDDDPLRGPCASLTDVADRRFITSPMELTCGRCVVVACRDAGFEPDIHHELDDYPTALHLVAAGLGVALVPDLGLVHVPAGVRTLDIDPPVSRTIQLAYRTVSAERPAVIAVRDTLLEVVADLEQSEHH